MEFLFGIIIWVCLSLLVGKFWQSRGTGFIKGLIISIILSPLIGFLIGVLTPPNVKEQERLKIEKGGMKKCPACAEFVKSEAIVCRFCGQKLDSGKDTDDKSVQGDEHLQSNKVVHKSSDDLLRNRIPKNAILIGIPIVLLISVPFILYLYKSGLIGSAPAPAPAPAPANETSLPASEPASPNSASAILRQVSDNKLTLSPAELHELVKYAGKHHAETHFFEIPELRTTLTKILGPELQHFIDNIQVASPTALTPSNCLVISGNKPHEGGSEEAMLIVNLNTGRVYCGLLSDDKVYVYSDQKDGKLLPAELIAWIGRTIDINNYMRGGTAKSVVEGTTKSVEEVYSFPERYEGQTVIFDQVRLEGDIKKEYGYFLLRVTSEGGGKTVYAVLQRDGITFITSPSIAGKLISYVSSSSEYLVRLTCQITTVNSLIGSSWVANIYSIEFYNTDGQIVKAIN